MTARARPPGICVDIDGHFEVACRMCGAVRLLLWRGPAESIRARQRLCEVCRFLDHRHRELDPVAVDLMVAGGYQVSASKTERILALRRLLDRAPILCGWQLADHLNVSRRTVERYRAELRRELTAA